MINGAVIAFDDLAVTGKPIISVTAANASGQHRSISRYATFDTGCTGDLTLRPDEISQLGLSFVTNQPAVLADGSVGHYDVYAGSNAWYGQQRIVPIYSVDSDPLAGMALLWNSRLTIDVIRNGTVTLTPLES